MTIECDNVVSGLAGELAVSYLAFQLRNRRWSAVVAFVVICALLCCGSQLSIVPCSNICVCLLLAIIGSNVVALPVSAGSNSLGTETFANPDERKKGRKDKDVDEDVDEDADEDVDKDADGDRDSDGDDENEHHRKGNKKHKAGARKTRQKGKARQRGRSGGGDAGSGSDSDDEPDDPDEPDHVDTFSTFMETYRSLSPDQVESMTTDTRDLISTQKALMETVQTLAPVITQGKEMMDTFKDYFGPNGTNDMLQAFKSKKTV